MVTMSPFFTPPRLSADAKRFTSRYSSQYVSVRLSPGSPSHSSAAFCRRGPCTWRSRQFTEALSLPPMNHLAKGGFQSSAFVHGLIQDSSFACFSQKRTGLRLASACSEPSLTRAFLTKSLDGGNFRPSLSSASMGSSRPVALAIDGSSFQWRSEER